MSRLESMKTVVDDDNLLGPAVSTSLRATLNAVRVKKRGKSKKGRRMSMASVSRIKFMAQMDRQ